jgi:putative transposase
MSAPDRRAMLARDDKALSLRRQCALLGVARSGVYRPRKAANDNNVALMRQIDELFTAWPFLGSRRMTAMLRASGADVNRKRVQRLMRLMGIAALGPKPRTTRPAPGHKIYPYLLRNLAIKRVNQVWAADITYIPIGRGFLYLVAIIDWASRAVLGVAAVEHDGRLVLSGGARRGLRQVRQAGDFQHRPGVAVYVRRFRRGARRHRRRDLHGRPRPLDGQRFHRAAVAVAQARGRLSQGYADGRQARAGIAAWIAFYNERRLHQALGYRTPMAVWREGAAARTPWT